MTEKKNIILLIADSARADVFEKLLKEDKLPNIQKHIVDRGCFKKILSVFPTTTGPAHIPFLTGMHPGNINVPGYRWIDRNAIDKNLKIEKKWRSYNSISGLRLHRDVSIESKTIFEYFDKPAIILEPFNYSKTRKLINPIFSRIWRMILAHYTRYWKPVDRFTKNKTLKYIKKGCDCIISVFLGIDEYSHLTSPFSNKTIECYINLDKSVGEIVKLLKIKNKYENTILTVCSDHGQTKTHTHISLVKILQDNNFNPVFFPKIFKFNADSAVMESGNGMAHLYFKNNNKWGNHLTEKTLIKNTKYKNIINTLSAIKGISFLAMKTKNGIAIYNKIGKLYADLNKNQTITIRIQDKNPLGGKIKEGNYTKKEILNITYNDKYPDAINQLIFLFNSKRSGDIILSAEKGYDLRKKFEHPEHKSSHGALLKEHMLVPFAVNIKISSDKFSTTDTFPTILNRINKKIPKNIDGNIIK